MCFTLPSSKAIAQSGLYLPTDDDHLRELIQSKATLRLNFSNRPANFGSKGKILVVLRKSDEPSQELHSELF